MGSITVLLYVHCAHLLADWWWPALQIQIIKDYEYGENDDGGESEERLEEEMDDWNQQQQQQQQKEEEIDVKSREFNNNEGEIDDAEEERPQAPRAIRRARRNQKKAT